MPAAAPSQQLRTDSSAKCDRSGRRDTMTKQSFGGRMHVAAVLIFILAALLFSYLYIIRPWHLHWGATHLDRIAVLPGDALSPFASAIVTHAVSIDAPAEAVWRWLVQIGQERARLYSYSFLANLVRLDMRHSF